MNLSIQDTHKLPYMKGKFTAVRLGTTQPVKFYDSDDVDLGYEIYTNAQGYICDANGNLLGNGVFVKVDSLITCTYNGSCVTQWVTRSQLESADQVNDGKLLNKDGNVVWSANNAGNYTLDYNDLKNQPPLNQWKEDEEIVIMEQAAENVAIGKFVKVLQVGSSVAADYLLLGIGPEDTNRVGQNIFVKNGTASILTLVNSDQSVICKITPNGSALISLLSTRLFTALEIAGSSGDGLVTYASTVTTGASDVNIFNITDDTPTVIIVNDSSDLGTQEFSMAKRFGFIGLSKPRKITVMWQPVYNITKKLHVKTSLDTVTYNTCAKLLPYVPCEFLVLPAGILNGVTVYTLIPSGLVTERDTCVATLTATCSNNVTNLVRVPSAADLLLVNIVGAVYNSTKTVVRLRLEVEPNTRQDFVLAIESGLENIPNLEIQLQIKCGSHLLIRNFGDSNDTSLTNGYPIYRRQDSTPVTHLTPAFFLKVLGLIDGGYMFITNQNDVYSTSQGY